VLLFGFLLGLGHTLDLDHLVAVLTIASENKSVVKSLLIGGAWGLGHTVVLFIVGILVLAFKLTIPDSVARLFEFAVGIMLIILGILVIRTVWLNRTHIHRHRHEKYSHIHIHSHKNTEDHRHMHKSLLVGMLQALAGSAVLMLLVFSTMKTIVQGFAFILMFGIGTIVGMTTIGALISLPFLFTKWSIKIDKATKVIIGLISVGLGLSITLAVYWGF
jgi:cytochrome c biogenesis protein CcdA